MLWLTGLCQGWSFDTVVIDPGHGGTDPGSEWFGVKEKDLTLDLGLRMERILQARGIKTVMTRRTDVFVDLGERAEIANRHREAVFISLHFNATVSGDITGVETYYLSEGGMRLAEVVHSHLMRKLNTRDRGVKRNSLKVLRDTKGMSILIEGGFISNRWENQRCRAPWYRQILAEEIVAGLIRFR
ncbi:MAG: N-acetylmuramoyl-L-alanine amidase [Verrucomicrobia bacterium]|nr:N-acetylmuramoyl-L-alanine amidase [Verrucomicrobiota bacterium]